MCEFCSAGGVAREKWRCCWGVAMELKNFKRRVLRKYLIAAWFDMTISIASLITDIMSLIKYAQRKKWLLAVVTAFPVLLPTIVFTNVYMADENRGYCTLPKNRRPKLEKQSKSGFFDKFSGQNGGLMETAVGPYSCCTFFSRIMQSIWHGDKKRGAKMTRKFIRRSFKYFWGTFILRFIAWTWYLKALIFGVKAMREPKKFMKIEEPDAHWSRQLLVRLDFFQAALENAPQCVIQLYVLLTDNEEDQVLGTLTLLFSFIDFVRVATSVLWNVDRGPVLVPELGYGSRLWQLLNVISWVFLYVARCSSISLIVGTALAAKGGVIAVPVIAGLLHCGIISILISKLKQAGQVSKKLVVTTFISIFFLPDLDNPDVHKVSQFYYTMTILENVFFIVPWGWDLSFTGFCFARKPQIQTTTPIPDETEESSVTMEQLDQNIFETESSSDQPLFGGTIESHCLIDPVLVVLLVPTLTIVGILLRLAASKNMNKLRRSQTRDEEEVTSFVVEERVANIYNRRWTKMTVQEMWTAFSRMLRKEVAPKSTRGGHISNHHGKMGSSQQKIDIDDDKVAVVTTEFLTHFRNSQNAIQQSLSAIVALPLVTNQNEKDDMVITKKVDANNFKNDCSHFARKLPCPADYYSHEFLYSPVGIQLFQNLDIRFLKVETEDGVEIFETIHI